MTTRHWWLGVGLLLSAILLHAAVPRYEWRTVAEHPYEIIRVDRWTGRAELGIANRSTGSWTPVRP